MSDPSATPLARFLGWLLGQSSSSDGSGQAAAVETTWTGPVWMLIILGGACLATAVFFYGRERALRSRSLRIVLPLLRGLVVVLVMFMLWGAQLRPYRTDLPDLAVAIDVSESMGLSERLEDKQLAQAAGERLASSGLEEPTRLHQAQSALLARQAILLHELEGKYHVRCFLIGQSTRPLSAEPAELESAIRKLQPTDPASRLGQAVRDILDAQRGRPTAAIILLTDGVTTEGKSLAEAASMARARGVPLFPVGVGSDRPPRNLRLADLTADDQAFAGDRLTFDFRVWAAGNSTPFRVRLKRKGESAALDEATVTPASNGAAQSVSLHDTPSAEGKLEYEISADPLEGETDLSDNILRHIVTVSNPTLRVLLVGETPSYEFRYLKNLLGRQVKRGASAQTHAFELSTLLQEADWAKIEPTARAVFPVTQEELNQYHVVIFCDVDPLRLESGGTATGGEAQKHLVEFVREHGGGVVFVSGPRHLPKDYLRAPLAELFPCEGSSVALPDSQAAIARPFSPALTRLGREHPPLRSKDGEQESEAALRSAPGFYWLADIGRVRPGVRVLLEHPDRTLTDGARAAVITSQYVGGGQVVFHATDETWRWRFRAGQSLFDHYWIQTLRQLARSSVFQQAAGLHLVSGRSQYRVGDAVQLRAIFTDPRRAPGGDEGLPVHVKGGDGTIRRLSLRREGSRRGAFTGSLSDLGEGEYQAFVASDPAALAPFRIAPPLGERAAREMDAADLQRAASESGGRFHTLANVDALLDELPAGRQVRIESLPPAPLWNAWPVAALLVGFLVAEWLLRKRAGLV